MRSLTATRGEATTSDADLLRALHPPGDDRLPRQPADPPDQMTDDAADQRATGAVVADALRRLSPEHRQVLLETYYRGSSVAQAANRLGVPTGTVKSRTHYALHALRLALEERGGVE